MSYNGGPHERAIYYGEGQGRWVTMEHIAYVAKSGRWRAAGKTSRLLAGVAQQGHGDGFDAVGVPACSREV